MGRRLAAILSMDVVGYSRLMAADEAGTLARLKACRQATIDPLVAEHQGRLFKLMGDGALVEFASVVHAVTCAVAIQRAVAAHNVDAPEAQRLAFRIGVNLGDVMIDGDDVYGDGVNIAARLQQIAEAGAVYVSASVLEHVGGRVDIAFDDCGEQRLKNIDRPLRVFRARLHDAGAAQAPARIGGSHVRETPSIAVLPFTNMSGDAGQEYFSDGITEDIITELSRFRSLFVIARNTSFSCRGVDVREVSRKLGVQYVVEGSVRRAGSRIRITAQLIDAAAANHLWAERYDREAADIFAVQDDVARQIVSNIAPRLQLEDRHSATRRAPHDMRAYDHYLQAKNLVDIPRDVADLKRAREHCERAIEINPGYARAHAYKAMSYVVGIPMMETEDPEDWQQHALASAERAVALDDLDNVCHWALGEASFWARQPERALRHIRRAIALNPNDADVLAISSYFEAAIGDPDVAARHLAMAFERNPTNPNWYHWVAGVTMAFLGRYGDALAEYDLCDPPNLDVLKLRTIALVQLGRLEEAYAQVRVMLALRPDLTIRILQKRDTLLPDAKVRTESLRLAGVPE